MNQDSGISGSQPAQSSPGGSIPLHTVLGERYSSGAFVRSTATAEIYNATDLETDRAVHAHVIHRQLASTADLREVVMNAAHAAIALAHPNVVRTLDTRFDGHHCVVITEPIEGNGLRDLLTRRAESGQAGLGARGVINVMDAICHALHAAADAGIAHGSVSADAVFVDGDGTVRVAGFGLGALEAAAVQEGILAKPHDMAPETGATGEPSAQGDVHCLGMLMYELLVGQPLVRGGPRPSAVVPGLSQEMDRLMATAVSPQREQRPTLEAFEGGLRMAFAPVAAPGGADLDPGASLAHAISATAARATIDPELLADTEEKYLISKGRLDYGPYSLADVVEQIRTDHILPGNVLIDNHTGERCNVEDHPILSVIVDQAKQARDDARRANAEVVHAKQEKRRGATLYLVIAAGVAALALVAYFVVVNATKAKNKTEVAGISAVGAGEFNAKITFPKKAAKKKPTRKSSGAGSSGGDDGVTTMDMSDDSVGSDRLDDSVISGVIQGYGGKLGGCLASNGGGYAKINFSIAGATGRANSVKVNGQASGGLYNCVNRVIRSMKFPTFNGQRTLAEFDMEL